MHFQDIKTSTIFDSKHTKASLVKSSEITIQNYVSSTITATENGGKTNRQSCSTLILALNFNGFLSFLVQSLNVYKNKFLTPKMELNSLALRSKKRDDQNGAAVGVIADESYKLALKNLGRRP